MKNYFFLFLAHVISDVTDLEKTHLAAEFHHSGTFSLGAMSPFRVFVKYETGKLLFIGKYFGQSFFIIQLVPIKTLQSLYAKFRLINESFETNLDCTIIIRD